MSLRTRALTPAVLAAGALLLLSACGSSSTGSTSSSSPATPSSSPTAAPSALPSQAQAQFAKIQECLSAAGIDLPTPSLPAGATPGGSFSPPAGGSFSPPAGGGGGGLSQLNNPQVKAALDACGISLPSGGPGAPSASPS